MPTKYFIYFNLIPITLTLVIGLINYRYFTKPLRIFLLFVAYGMVNEYVVQFFIRILKSRNTLPFNHAYGFVAILILGIFFVHILKGFINRKGIYMILGAYLFYYVINSFFIQSLFVYPTYARAVGVMLMLALVILYFAKVMNEAKIEKLSAEPLIWLNSGLLVWFSGSFFFFITFNVFMVSSMEFLRTTVAYYGFLNVILYTLISIGFVKARRNYLLKKAQ